MLYHNVVGDLRYTQIDTISLDLQSAGRSNGRITNALDTLSLDNQIETRFFAALIAPALAAGARLGVTLPAGAVRLAPETGLPAAIHLAQELALPAPLPAQVDRLLAEDVAPVIRLLQTETGLSARLLWENAGSHLFWTLKTIARENPERAAEADAALTLMRADAPAGFEAPRRRICCLRHGLSGFSKCEGICPLHRRSGET